MRSEREQLQQLRVLGIRLVWVISAIVHQVIGLFGVPTLSAVLTFSLCSIAQSLYPTLPANMASKLLIQMPGYPVQATFGLLLGFILGRYWQRRVMLWVWVLPLVLFILALLFPPFYGSAIFGPYYPQEAHHHSTLLEQLSWTIVLIPSAAYALGAKLAKPHNVAAST